ncbi:MAG: sugar ABC transporter permease, partial [Cryobacterium sp.]|nr:sugar ABC transporter permease [Cryobacterium sp.]
MSNSKSEKADELAADLQDERLIHYEGIGGSVRGFIQKVRGGDLGSLPVIIGLILIWAVFQFLNPNFLSSRNLVDLTMQSAATGTIAIGVVLVLLIAQIDLSVGSISGLAAAIVAVGWMQLGWPAWLAIVVAVLAALVIGFLYGILYTRFGVPTFVITLAGLLAILGLQLKVLGAHGSINLPFDSWFVQLGTTLFLPPWAAYALAVIAGLGMFFSNWSR